MLCTLYFDIQCQFRPRNRHYRQKSIQLNCKTFISIWNDTSRSQIAVLVTEILTICHSNLHLDSVSENAEIGGSIRPPYKGCIMMQLKLLQEPHLPSVCVKAFNSSLPALRVMNLSWTPSPSSLLCCNFTFNVNLNLEAGTTVRNPFKKMQKMLKLGGLLDPRRKVAHYWNLYSCKCHILPLSVLKHLTIAWPP